MYPQSHNRLDPLPSKSPCRTNVILFCALKTKQRKPDYHAVTGLNKQWAPVGRGKSPSFSPPVFLVGQGLKGFFLGKGLLLPQRIIRDPKR